MPSNRLRSAAHIQQCVTLQARFSNPSTLIAGLLGDWHRADASLHQLKDLSSHDDLHVVKRLSLIRFLMCLLNELDSMVLIVLTGLGSS